MHRTRLSSDLMLQCDLLLPGWSPLSGSFPTNAGFVDCCWWTVLGGLPWRQHFVCSRWDMREMHWSAHNIITPMSMVLKLRRLLLGHRVHYHCCCCLFCPHSVLCSRFLYLTHSPVPLPFLPRSPVCLCVCVCVCLVWRMMFRATVQAASLSPRLRWLHWPRYGAAAVAVAAALSDGTSVLCRVAVCRTKDCCFCCFGVSVCRYHLARAWEGRSPYSHYFVRVWVRAQANKRRHRSTI